MNEEEGRTKIPFERQFTHMKDEGAVLFHNEWQWNMCGSRGDTTTDGSGSKSVTLFPHKESQASDVCFQTHPLSKVMERESETDRQKERKREHYYAKRRE